MVSPTQFYSLLYNYDGGTVTITDQPYSVYTTTLPLGDIMTVERRSSYSEVYIVTLLVFVSLMSVLGIIVIAVRFKG